MRCHLKGLLPASPFLDYVFSSELKNSKTFFTLSFGQQMKDIVLQTNFFNFSLHLRRNIFVWTNFRECRGLDISHGFIFTNGKDFTSKYTKKSETIS